MCVKTRLQTKFHMIFHPFQLEIQTITMAFQIQKSAIHKLPQNNFEIVEKLFLLTLLFFLSPVEIFQKCSNCRSVFAIYVLLNFPRG